MSNWVLTINVLGMANTAGARSVNRESGCELPIPRYRIWPVFWRPAFWLATTLLESKQWHTCSLYHAFITTSNKHAHASVEHGTVYDTII